MNTSDQELLSLVNGRIPQTLTRQIATGCPESPRGSAEYPPSHEELLHHIENCDRCRDIRQRVHTNSIPPGMKKVAA